MVKDKMWFVAVKEGASNRIVYWCNKRSHAYGVANACNMEVAKDNVKPTMVYYVGSHTRTFGNEADLLLEG